MNAGYFVFLWIFFELYLGNRLLEKFVHFGLILKFCWVELEQCSVYGYLFHTTKPRPFSILYQMPCETWDFPVCLMGQTLFPLYQHQTLSLLILLDGLIAPTSSSMHRLIGTLLNIQGEPTADLQSSPAVQLSPFNNLSCNVYVP